MLIFAVFAALILVPPILGISPPVDWNGRDVTNRIFAIEMLPPGHAKYGEQGLRFRPIFAQELAEWWLAWAVALAMTAPVATALSTLLPGLAGTGLAIALSPLAWQWRTTRWGERQLEYVGHAAEWLKAERMQLRSYTQELVGDRLKHGYVHLFAGMTVTEVGRAVRRRRWLARILVALLALRIGRAAHG